MTTKRNRLGTKKLEDLVILKENQETIDRISFDKVQIECDRHQELEDEFDHELLCDNFDWDDDNDEDILADDEEIIDE